MLELTALNRKNGDVKRQITAKIAALTAFSVAIKALTAFKRKKTVLGECNRKDSSVNDVQPEK